jgi:hypothetical protein
LLCLTDSLLSCRHDSFSSLPPGRALWNPFSSASSRCPEFAAMAVSSSSREPERLTSQIERSGSWRHWGADSMLSPMG